MIRALLGAALALTILATAGPAAAQDEAEGPRVFGMIGVERPYNVELDQDLLLRWGAGLEWPGVFGYDDVWFLGQFQQVGWGTDEVETTNLWNWGFKAYPQGYLSRVEPFVALGVEHRGGGLIVGQRNYTWIALGFEPAIPVGWLQVSWQASGWLMDEENLYRFVIDFVPGGVLD